MADKFDKQWSGIGIGGSIATDFTNTLDWRLRRQPVELLRTYPDLLRWGRSAGVLDPKGERALREWAEAHPRRAAKALADAVEVREAIAQAFEALLREDPIPAEVLARLDGACREAGAARALRAEGSGLVWDWKEPHPGPERVAWAAALEAARILTSSDRRRLRQCGDRECGWFFLDTSRNRTRRWCSMKSCGNRNKARTFYRRSVEGQGERAK